ncbi:hypothetical protein Ga0466249_004969 [Sporomusaceae bacterium BoRhaA]|nr:hypothetical protein [Pelorhabdus rhamnosifermentans]
MPGIFLASVGATYSSTQSTSVASKIGPAYTVELSGITAQSTGTTAATETAN